MLDSTRTIVERRLAATSSEHRAICSAYTSTREYGRLEPLSGLLATPVFRGRRRRRRHRSRRRCVARLRVAGANPRRQDERSGGAPVTWRRGS